jgi:hypothetical protein
MTTRFFRRPNRYFPGKFDDWREIAEAAGVVTVFFGTSETWPPATRKQSEGRLSTHEAECAATLARGFEEVGADGRLQRARSEEDVVSAFSRLGPFERFVKLRANLLVTKAPALTLDRLLTTLREIEIDIDEHDSAFPGPEDIPPDMGAVVAYRQCFEQLAARVERGQTLTAEERAYTYSPADDRSVEHPATPRAAPSPRTSPRRTR